jgi:hypothetical protein
LIHVNITKTGINMQKAALLRGFPGCDTALWHIVAAPQGKAWFSRSGA